MNKLLLAYFGTPDFSARLLEKILEDKQLPLEVKLIVTQPDKKIGRKQILTPSAVKLAAQKYKLPTETSLKALKLSQFDLCLLFAYGEVIPEGLLKDPKYGFWNIHPSLLPKYRGASPVACPLINGDKETGVTIVQMDEKIDHGSILAQGKIPILPEEKRDKLTNRLADIGLDLFQETLLDLIEGQLTKEIQDEKKATYTKLLTKNDGFISFEQLKIRQREFPQELFNRFRGLYPWPGLWTEIGINGQKKRLKITAMEFENGRLELKKVQLEGKKETIFEQFKEAYL